VVRVKLSAASDHEGGQYQKVFDGRKRILLGLRGATARSRPANRRPATAAAQSGQERSGCPAENQWQALARLIRLDAQYPRLDLWTGGM